MWLCTVTFHFVKLCLAVSVSVATGPSVQFVLCQLWLVWGVHPFLLYSYFFEFRHWGAVPDVHGQIVQLAPDLAIEQTNYAVAASCKTTTTTTSLPSIPTCIQRFSPFISINHIFDALFGSCWLVTSSIHHGTIFSAPSPACRHRRDSGVIAATFLVAMSFTRSTIRSQTLAKFPLPGIASQERQPYMLVEGVSHVFWWYWSPERNKHIRGHTSM